MKEKTELKMSNIDTYLEAIEAFGPHNQICCCLEELSELQVELAKTLNCKRDPDKPEDLKLLVDELADATIMIEQMLILFDCGFDVMERKNYKLDLLKQKIQNKKKETM